MRGESVALAVFVAMVAVSLALLAALALVWWSVRQVDAEPEATSGEHGQPGGVRRRPASRTGPLRVWRTRGRDPGRARKQQVRVPVTAELHDQLLQLAHRDGVSITDVIADSLVLYRLVRQVGAQRPWPPKHRPDEQG